MPRQRYQRRCHLVASHEGKDMTKPERRSPTGMFSGSTGHRRRKDDDRKKSTARVEQTVRRSSTSFHANRRKAQVERSSTSSRMSQSLPAVDDVSRITVSRSGCCQHTVEKGYRRGRFCHDHARDRSVTRVCRTSSWFVYGSMGTVVPKSEVRCRVRCSELTSPGWKFARRCRGARRNNLRILRGGEHLSKEMPFAPPSP